MESVILYVIVGLLLLLLYGVIGWGVESLIDCNFTNAKFDASDYGVGLVVL